MPMSSRHEWMIEGAAYDEVTKKLAFFEDRGWEIVTVHFLPAKDANESPRALILVKRPRERD